MLIPVVQEFRNSLADWFWHGFLMKFLSRWSQELHLSEGLTVAGGSAPKTVLPHGAGCWHGTSVAPHVDSCGPLYMLRYLYDMMLGFPH